MTEIIKERTSPVKLPGRAVRTAVRDHWPVVLEYAEEGAGPWLVDLSHCRRWDIQGEQLNQAVRGGLSVPASPGEVMVRGGSLTGRTGARQLLLWHLDGDAARPEGRESTEITEGTLCLALIGKEIFRITEKLGDLDLADPARTAPFLLLGPFAHVTSQIIVLGRDPRSAVVLIACSRAFGRDMVQAIIGAGEEFGLRLAGEDRFKDALRSLSG